MEFCQEKTILTTNEPLIREMRQHISKIKGQTLLLIHFQLDKANGYSSTQYIYIYIYIGCES